MTAGGWLLMVTAWAAFIAVVVWAISRLFPRDPTNEALRRLDRRLADGTIDADAYHQARDALTRHAPQDHPVDR